MGSKVTNWANQRPAERTPPLRP